jgi:hypothetical protein
MPKLTDLRKQITQLEAEFARTTKVEMEVSVGKVISLMTSLGVTLEHLGVSLPSSKAKQPASARVKSKATVQLSTALWTMTVRGFESCVPPGLPRRYRVLREGRERRLPLLKEHLRNSARLRPLGRERQGDHTQLNQGH